LVVAALCVNIIAILAALAIPAIQKATQKAADKNATDITPVETVAPLDDAR
jgi:Tfp pilus assembly major pilin PilA